MRRVVVTGLGMVSPLAWRRSVFGQRLLAGQSGAGPIVGFETSDSPANRNAGITRRAEPNGTFNPDQWIEPEEQRKVDDYLSSMRLPQPRKRSPMPVEPADL